MNMKSIVLAVDKDASGGAVAIAAGLASRLDARITMVHFGSRVTPGDDAFAEAIKSLDGSGATFEVRLEELSPGASKSPVLVTPPAETVLTDRGER
jgi:sugar/nucleoside kinase (ribokinase family)